jgi:hypothetical protein
MKKITFFVALISPFFLWSQTQLSRAYLGDDGVVLTENFTVEGDYLQNRQASSISQMPGFPKKIAEHQTFKNFRNVTLADVDNDGKEEILVATKDQLRVFEHTGELLWSKLLIGTPIYPPTVAVMDAAGTLGIVQVTGGSPNNGRIYYLNATGDDMAGYPMTFLNHWIICAAAIADVDDDGTKEIIVQTRTSNDLHVLKTDGTILWTANLGGTPAVTPSVADIDNDGIVDIVTGTSNGIMHAYNADGTIKTGFPIASDSQSLSYQSPLLVDLDGNNQLSIVGASHGTLPKYYVRNSDGTYRTGWPVAVPDGSWTYSPPTVVDYTGNNDFRIFTSKPINDVEAPMLFGFMSDGTMLPNFPISKPGGLESFISVADITNDGVHDLIFGSNLMVESQGFIHAYKTDGTGQIEGFPLRPTGFTFMNGATLGDVNGDGLLDLVSLSYEQTFSATDSAYINVYELGIPLEQANVLFGTYKGSNDRTGFVPRSAAPSNPVPHNLTGTVKGQNVTLNWQEPDIDNDGTGSLLSELLGYNVYRDDNQVNTFTIEETSYEDLDVAAGNHIYTVTAVYTDGESQKTPPVSVVIGGTTGKIQGFIRDAYSNLAIEDEAQIVAANMENGVLNYTTPFGSHYSMLVSPGTYDVTCSVDGYETATVYNIEVEEGGARSCTFYLIPTDGNELTTGTDGLHANQFEVYPNPANTQINIDGKYIKNIEILNAQGLIVYQNTRPIHKNQINVEQLASGIYMVKVETSTGINTQKIVVE